MGVKFGIGNGVKYVERTARGPFKRRLRVQCTAVKSAGGTDSNVCVSREQNSSVASVTGSGHRNVCESSPSV